jgi:hypothetical protein
MNNKRIKELVFVGVCAYFMGEARGRYRQAMFELGDGIPKKVTLECVMRFNESEEYSLWAANHNDTRSYKDAFREWLDADPYVGDIREPIGQIKEIRETDHGLEVEWAPRTDVEIGDIAYIRTDDGSKYVRIRSLTDDDVIGNEFDEPHKLLGGRQWRVPRSDIISLFKTTPPVKPLRYGSEIEFEHPTEEGASENGIVIGMKDDSVTVALMGTNPPDIVTTARSRIVQVIS